MLESAEADEVRLSLDALKMVDDLCDAFEARLRGGEEPDIEAVLADSPETCRPQLFRELLKMEREYRQKRADEDYRRRFPEYASALDALRVPDRVEAVAHTADFTTVYHESAGQRDLTLPTIVGYEILARLGEGGMGVVYKARQLKLERIVALKMMKAGQFATPEERQRFRFEAEAIAALDHPNIAPVYDVGAAAGDSYLCLKYLERGSLADRLKVQPYTPTEAAKLVLTITLAIQHAHDRGVLHRDLKPANILLDAEDRPHVADFGLARRLTAEHGLTRTGAIVGTLNYMAPEQARGERGVTVTADVYALGAILYELLTGRPPVKGETLLETFTLLSQGSAVTRPHLLNQAVPIDLEAICLKCLEKDPVHRYVSAAALADDLGHFLNDEPVSAQPPGVWDWLVQAMRTRPQPSPEYTWPAPIWLGGLLFAQHLAIFALVEATQPVWLLWTVLLAGWLGLVLVVWFLLLRRFRLVPLTERHTIILSIGHLTAQVVLFLTVGPLSLQGSCREVLPLYPPLTIVSGLCFFILGSTNWGRFLPIGLLVMWLALVMVVWPETGPALFAAVVPFLLIWWGLAKWWYFVRCRETAPLRTERTSSV